jgi:hypothetical protein
MASSETKTYCHTQCVMHTNKVAFRLISVELQQYNKTQCHILLHIKEIRLD